MDVKILTLGRQQVLLSVGHNFVFFQLEEEERAWQWKRKSWERENWKFRNLRWHSQVRETPTVTPSWKTRSANGNLYNQDGLGNLRPMILALVHWPGVPGLKSSSSRSSLTCIGEGSCHGPFPPVLTLQIPHWNHTPPQLPCPECCAANRSVKPGFLATLGFCCQADCFGNLVRERWLPHSTEPKPSGHTPSWIILTWASLRRSCLVAEGSWLAFVAPSSRDPSRCSRRGGWGTWQVRGCLGCLVRRPSPKSENSSRVTLLRVRATMLRDELGRTQGKAKAQMTDSGSCQCGTGSRTQHLGLCSPLATQEIRLESRLTFDVVVV